MRLSTRVEPDCSGRCACSHTAAQFAIVSITSGRKSLGCGLVNRMRSMPSTASTALSSSAKPVSNSGRRSRPYEFTFWPSSVTSRTPWRASPVTSARISPGRRLTSLPRTRGTMQYEQTELQPIETCTHACTGRSRIVGSSAEKRRSSAMPNAWRSTPTPPAPSQSPRCPIVPGPKATSTNGYRSKMRSRCASA